MKEIFWNTNIRKNVILSEVNHNSEKDMNFLYTLLQEIKSFTVPGAAYSDIN